MQLVFTFLVAFAFSLLGSVPPGTLNLTALRLGLENNMRAAIGFSLAAALMEYPYAWLALVFENWITGTPAVVNNLKLVAALVMIVLGVLMLRSARKPVQPVEAGGKKGFVKGLILGALNPLALPFWIGITAYLKMQGWITLSSPLAIQSYLAGICLGAFVLLVSVAYLATRASITFSLNNRARLIPAAVLLALGGYTIVDYALSTR